MYKVVKKCTACPRVLQYVPILVLSPECFLLCHSLRRQVSAVNKLSDKGMFFWDYGNAFLLEAQRAGEYEVDLYDRTILRNK